MACVHSEEWKKRHAMALAAQLPERHDEAIAVLNYMQKLVTGFLATPEVPQRERVVRFEAGGGNSASLPAKSNGSPSLRPL